MSNQRSIIPLPLVASLWVVGRCVAAPSAQEVEFFETRVRPVLAEHCYQCHGPEKQKAELRVDSREALLKGGDGGPVLVVGDPGRSSLIRSIRHEGDSKMPAKADKLSDDKIAALTEWVRAGAPWPEGDRKALSSRDRAAREHWAFQPVADPKPPVVEGRGERIFNPVDAFLVARLREAGLQQAPAASRRTLIRRVSFDLTGLPPTAAEVDAFEGDGGSDREAYARMVDRLLESPRYGERWGRYWLDIARYADSIGYLAGGVERKFPFSYTYRDWVIGAFNADMGYDRFVRLQVAADQMGEGPEHLAAMGFLTVGRRFLNNINDIIDDRIDVVSRGVMGLTTACARCHDHKFDPISQKDYYALYGVFASSEEPVAQDLPVLSTKAPSPEYVEEKAKRQAELDGFYGERALEIATAFAQTQGLAMVLPLDAVEAMMKSEFFTRKARNDQQALKNKLVRVEMNPNAPPRGMVLVDKAQPVNPRVFVRGNPGRPGDAVPRRFLSVLSGGDPKPFEKGSGRMELGQALTDRGNPLTARVFVNWVWGHHFGNGLVRTPGDFGVKGDAPTHPELLDWLATRFMEGGWSAKKLHRLMLLSAAYQQVSDPVAGAVEKDPENRLLSHMNRQRLDFEAVRDSLLYVAGQLDAAMGGQPVDLLSEKGGLRRSVYAFIDRQNLPGMFRAFDFANPDTTTARRHQTTVPQQALFMMNSAFISQRAGALVARPEFKRSEVSEWQVQDLYRRVFARDADAGEVDAALRFVAQQAGQPAEPEPEPVWQYGMGGVEDGAVRFEAFRFFEGGSWQVGKTFPDAKLGHVRCNAQGGHAGDDAMHAAVRRWKAPMDGVLKVEGVVGRPSKDGDGVRVRLVSSRAGMVGDWEVGPGASVAVGAQGVEVRKGDTVDLLVDCRENPNSDTFTLGLVLQLGDARWDSKKDFAGPPQPRLRMSAWEKYAQVLLATNEFVFVD